MAANLTAAHRQWASRPDDERFTSLVDLADHCQRMREGSAARVISTRDLAAIPIKDDDRGLVVAGPDGAVVAPTHWAFGQLAQRAGAPASYLRDLPAPLAADCINWGLRERAADDVGVLLRKREAAVELGAVTGSGYGRVWNATIARALVDRFGDGRTGAFRVPGIRGQALDMIDKGNTTLYASDRDLWIFLADEERRIEVPNRRNGQPGNLARGFFVWNSETGAATFGVATFLFDFVCANRIVWGAEDYREIRVRHTASAPHRWIEEVAPAIQRYAQSSAESVTRVIEEARAKRLGDGEAVAKFLASRAFTRSQVRAIEAAHLADEGRPIETLWDAVTGTTAYARSLPWQDERVEVERKGGAMLALAGGKALPAAA